MMRSKTGYFQPAEWHPHAACWLAWPSHKDLWQDNLIAAQGEFTALARAIASSETLHVLVPTQKALAQATQALAGLNVHFHEIPFGDIWLRDTAPIFLMNSEGHRRAASFLFNGWGGKYVLPFDAEVSLRVAEQSGEAVVRHDWILEGGSVEVDGEGSILSSTQCLLNPNRNPGLNKAQIEEKLCTDLGGEKVLWLRDGLLNDHTDGHIDTIARFVAPGTVMCMQAASPSDPNYTVLEEIADDLSQMIDARGRPLKVLRIPSAGSVHDEDGRLMPASFLNFYISNAHVIVPTYGTPFDAEAVQAVVQAFPQRKTLGLSARAILSGGGAFHCISQQVPEAVPVLDQAPGRSSNFSSVKGKKL